MGPGKYLQLLRGQLNPTDLSFSVGDYLLQLSLQLLVNGTSPILQSLKAKAQADGDAAAVAYFNDVLTNGAVLHSGSFDVEALSSHMMWDTDGTYNIGVDNRITAGLGDGRRPRNVFISGGLVAGNVFGSTPPYNLNNSFIAGAICSGGVPTQVTTLLWSTNFFNGVDLGFMGFAKAPTFATCPGFISLSNVADSDVYFSLVKRSLARVDLVKFGGNGDLSVLAGNLRVSGSLGVGNSAAATTLGAVSKKIEVFNAAGVSLGFVPVYDSIS